VVIGQIFLTLTKRNKSIAAGHFFATTNIARATSSAREALGEVNAGTNHRGFRYVKDAETKTASR
jgi:hypothetical protein